MNTPTFLKFFVVLVFVFSCSKDDTTPIKPIDNSYKLEHEGLPNPNIAADNKLTKEGVALGRRLFYEIQLSKDNSMSCATCHVQENAFADTNRFSIGVEGLPGKRQAMAIFNMAWNKNEFFWDGRAHLLRDQALMPIQDPLEMNETLENVIAKLEAIPDYVTRFEKVFGSTVITEKRISLALEQFMNTIVSNNSKYDKVQRSEASYTASEARGKELFFKQFDPSNPSNSGANCAHCHGGANFENNDYMNNGLDIETDMEDEGRAEVVNNPLYKGAFKVPSLRNIAITPPYMHDGRFNTLEEVVDHYNNGIKISPTLNSTLASVQNNGGFQLSAQDKIDLVAFLKTLTDYELINSTEFSSPF